MQMRKCLLKKKEERIKIRIIMHTKDEQLKMKEKKVENVLHICLGTIIRCRVHTGMYLFRRSFQILKKYERNKTKVNVK